MEFIIFNVTLIPSEINNKRILFSALNWGTGHVARSISFIDELLEMKNEVIIACDSEQQEIYQQYFHSVRFIEHEGYPFYFGGNGSFMHDLLVSRKKLKKRLALELIQTEDLVSSLQIDIVISDHRYGFRSFKVPSIFITHQLNLPVCWFHLGVNIYHTRLMKKFDSIWVMDNDHSQFAGKLSQSRAKLNVKYIGVFSRFSRYEISKLKADKTVLIASGPDVYAQQLVNQVLVDKMGVDVICNSQIVFDEGKNNRIGSGWLEQDQAILNAGRIISRSGYSTIMDAEFLQVEVEFIPTPGQLEQIYLAKYTYRRLMERKNEY